MDIICPKCGEPWEHDMLHEAGLPYEEAWRRFKREGCAVFGSRCNEQAAKEAAEIAQIAYGLMPDDPDGCAAAFEDWGLGR